MPTAKRVMLHNKTELTVTEAETVSFSYGKLKDTDQSL